MEGKSVTVRRLAPPEQQPKSFAFSEDNRAFVAGEIKKYPKGRQRSAVIALLMRAQEQEGGWVSEPAIRHIADLLDMAPIAVLEVATFYTQFNLAPVGRYFVQVCGTTPCWLRGAEDLKTVCEEVIGPRDQVSDDGLFSWTEVECLGACVNAPMCLINKDTYEDLTPQTFRRILDGLREGRKLVPGPQNGRINAAPISGPTTLKA